MNRKEIIEEVKLRYLRNKPITEKEIVSTDLPFFHNVLEEFGSWHKMELEVGLKAKHIKEREKYFLFMKMKERKERFGVEALRHKNIEEDVKEKIAEYFRTVKKLTRDILDGWSQDRVLFEAHTYHLTGGTPENLEKDRSILYENIIKFFINIDNFYEEYEKRFLINPLKESRMNKQQVAPATVGFDINSLVDIGYMKPEQAEEIKKAAAMPKEQILEFVAALDESVDDQVLAKKNRVMWLAIKNQIGNLEIARKQLNTVASQKKQA